MKKIFICLLLLASMLTCTLPAHAAEAEITVQVRASKTDVQVGDTVEYTVLATGSDVVAMQFQVMLPEGLRYVSNSGATPEKLAQKLGVAAVDWTEQSMMFTFYNDIGITFAKGTEILRFSCVAEKEGTWDVKLLEFLPFNSNFEEFPPKLQVQTVNVITAAGEISAPSTEQTEPPVTGETVPAVTAPQEPTPPPTSESTEGPEPTVPTTEQTDKPVDTEAVPEPTVQQEEVPPTTERSADTEAVPEPWQPEEQPPKRTWIWLLPIGGILVIAAAVGAFLLLKKKRS